MRNVPPSSPDPSASPDMTDPAVRRRTATILGAAMAMGLVVLGVVCSVVMRGGDFEPTLQRFATPWLAATLVGVVTMAAVAFRVAPGAVDPAATKEADAKEMPKLIVGFALVEGVSMIAGVGVLLTGSLALLAPMALGVATIVLLTLRYRGGEPLRG